MRNNICYKFLILGFLFFPAFISVSLAQTPGLFIDGNHYVKTELISDRTYLQPPLNPDQPIGQIGVLFKIQKGWHIYWKYAGDGGKATELIWALPRGWQAGQLKYPAPTRFEEDGGLITYGYDSEVLLFADIFAPTDPKNTIGETTANKGQLNDYKEIAVTADWLVCGSGSNAQCVPGSITLTKKFVFSKNKPLNPSKEISIFNFYENLLPKPLSMASQLSEATIIPAYFRVSGQKRSFGGLEVRAVNKDIHKLVQLFPYSHKKLFNKLPKAARIGKNDFGVMFEMNSSKDSSLKGEIVFDTKLCKSKHPCTFEFQTPPASKAPITVASPLIDLQFQSHTNHIHVPDSKPAIQKHNQVSELSLSFDSILTTILSAFLAGMILNLMPCVLPVISIKLLSLIEHSSQPRAQSIKAASVYSAGILFTFTILASIVVQLKHLGLSVGWGFQFQHPEFVFAMTIVVFLLSLSLFDVFSLQLPGLGSFSKAQFYIKHPYVRHFLDGILATLLSTPCSAPFLGTALIIAFTQNTILTYVIFLSIGSGLALPYILVCTFPATKAILPKPGPWMLQLKQFLGYVLLGTVIWLLYVLNSLVPDSSTWAMVVCLLIALSFWAKNCTSSSSLGHFTKQLLSGTILGGFLILALPLMPRILDKEYSASGSLNWQPYAEDLMKEAKKNHRTVFIDFTAKWCVTCQTNKLFTLEAKRVARAFKDHNVLTLEADWTNEPKEISNALIRLTGQRSVPQYVIVPGNGATIKILPPLLTEKSVINALKDTVSGNS